MFQCPEGRYSSALLEKQGYPSADWLSFSAPKGVIAVRYPLNRPGMRTALSFQCPEGRYSSALQRRGSEMGLIFAFQCPEGRYSSALHDSKHGEFVWEPGFSAPKGVIAVRYRALEVLADVSIMRFQCPEGRYSSALLAFAMDVGQIATRFQCPEGRYSSALLPCSRALSPTFTRFSAPKGVIAVRYKTQTRRAWNVTSFSAPKGVIAVRYASQAAYTACKYPFQCPEGRYSSALLWILHGVSIPEVVSVPRRAL